MEQYIVRRIMNHIEQNVLYDGESFEEMIPIEYNEIKYLKPIIKENLLTAFSVNIAILYVNQGLLYAKNKLSVEAFDNYMIWFCVEKENDVFEEEHFYFSRVLFTKHARYYITSTFVNSFNIKDDTQFYDLIKDVNSLKDFYCYALPNSIGDVYYHFIPKCFVEKYSAIIE